MGKLYFVGFLFSWFKWTTKSAKIRTPTINNINDFTVSVNTELFKVSTYNTKLYISRS
jgi:hypothetical protein